MVSFTRKPLEGIMPLLPFSLKKNQKPDFEAIRENVELLIEKQMDGTIVFGSMGAHHAPSEEEFNKVTDTVVDATNGKIACVMGNTSTNTKEAKRRAVYAENAGADGVMMAQPYAFPLTREMGAKHFQEVNDAIDGDLAILGYNSPGLSRGLNMDASFWEEYLLDMENVKAIKESAEIGGGPFDTMLKIADKVNVFSFTEGQFWHLSEFGAKGIVAQWSWIAPEVFRKFFDECKKGNRHDEWVMEVYKTVSAPLYGYEEIPCDMGKYSQALLHAQVDIAGGKGGEVPLPYTRLPENARNFMEEYAEKLRSLKP